MSPDNSLHNPIHWRLKDERLRLEGDQCQICGTKHFPKKAVCPDCSPVGIGTIEMILEHSNNETREIELGIRLIENNLQIKINLNGKSHSVKFEAGMQLPVFVKRQSKKEEPIYFINPTSSSSK